MKKLTILTAGLWAIMMCECSQPQALPLLDEADFQATVDGKQTSLYTLKAGNLVMQVTNYGGRVVTLRT
ncbi:MAG: galactose-1-epimerase, partial [Tidjanibacter sp.]|nr:galactose-1-epimerase [Tidjanibacter sp.]